MRYFLKTRKSKSGNIEFDRKSDGSFLCISVENGKEYENKEWVLNNINDIDNASVNADKKVYPCKSKQEKYIRYIIELVKKEMKKEKGFSPSQLVMKNDKSLQINNDKIKELQEAMKSNKVQFENPSSIDYILSVIKRLEGFNVDRDYSCGYNSILLEIIIFTAIEELNQKSPNSVLMMINNITKDRVFFAKSSYMKAISHYDKLCRIDENVWCDGTCSIETMKNNFIATFYINP